MIIHKDIDNNNILVQPCPHFEGFCSPLFPFMPAELKYWSDPEIVHGSNDDGT